jgi:hypothetical protein
MMAAVEARTAMDTVVHHLMMDLVIKILGMVKSHLVMMTIHMEVLDAEEVNQIAEDHQGGLLVMTMDFLVPDAVAH